MPTKKQKKPVPRRQPPRSGQNQPPQAQRPKQSRRTPQSIRRPPQENHRAAPPQNRPPGSAKRWPPAQQRAVNPARMENPRTENIRQVQKRRRQKRKRNYTLHYILLFLFLSVTGVILSLTVFFNIETIEVQGSEIYTEEEILSYLEIREGDNLLRIDTGQAEEALLQGLTKADSVNVSRSFPNALRVTVTDGKPSAQLENAGKYYVISQSGRILSVGDAPETGSGILISGVDLTGAAEGEYVGNVQQRLWEEASALAEEQKEPEPEKPESVQNLKTFFAALKNAQYSRVTAVDLSDDLSLTLYWDNRIQILLGSFSELEYKLSFAKTLLTDEQYAEIIGPDAVGTLDVESTSSGVQFFPDPELQIPGDGVSVWNWDDDQPKEEQPEESGEEPSAESGAEPASDASEPLSSVPEEDPAGESSAPADVSTG